MSYDVHITKAQHWVQSEQNPITEKDLIKITDLVQTYKAIPFQFQQGRITVPGANDKVIGLMIEMAKKLGALVQGDDGEYYNYNSDKYPPPPEYLGQVSNENAPNTPMPDEKLIFIESLGINDEIRHRKHGAGKIIDITGEGEDKEFMVRFSEIDIVKKLLAYHSPIHPLT